MNGGQDENEGRVEVFHQNSWRGICDDGWGPEEADTVCRQLGYASGSATEGGIYGPADNGLIWLDSVECSGDENKLAHCMFPDWDRWNCQPSETAGVKCCEYNGMRK